MAEQTAKLIRVCCEHISCNYSDYEPRTLVFSLHMLSLFEPDQRLLRTLLPVTERFPLNLQTMLLGICERGRDVETAIEILERIAKVDCSDSGEAARALRSISRLPKEVGERFSDLANDLAECALKDTKSVSRIFAVCLALAKMSPERESVSKLLYRVMRAVITAGENLDLVDAATATSILVRLTTSTVIDGGMLIFIYSNGSISFLLFSEKCSPIMLPSRFCDPVGESIVNCILRSATTGRHLSTRDLDRASQCRVHPLRFS